LKTWKIPTGNLCREEPNGCSIREKDLKLRTPWQGLEMVEDEEGVLGRRVSGDCLD
jgi:hypothetical protein